MLRFIAGRNSSRPRQPAQADIDRNWRGILTDDDIGRAVDRVHKISGRVPVENRPLELNVASAIEALIKRMRPSMS